MSAEAPGVEQRIARIERGVLRETGWDGDPPGICPLAERMATLGVPGVSVAVIDGGRVDWARGFGVRENGGADPVTPHTVFQAASISKPVTAVAVMRLVQRGVLDLDEDVNRYLRGWQVPANGGWQPRVTLRLLLSHTAGTTMHGFPGYTGRAPLPRVVDILNGMPPANTDAVRVNGLPGVQVRYSGGGTTIVQQLLMDVTGRAFPDLMNELVLEPLDMRDSTYEQPLPAERSTQAAAGHRTGGAVVDGKWHVYPEMAAAGLWTTPSDLARLVIELQVVFAGGESTFLARRLVEQMWTPWSANQMGWSEAAGLGWFLDGTGDERRFSHGGDNEGYKCFLLGYCARGTGAIVMTNGDGGWLLHEELMRTIAAEYGWPGYLPRRRERASVDTAVYAAYTGTYEAKPDLRFEIATTGDALTLQIPGQSPVELIPALATEFWAEVVRLEASFAQARDGTAATLRIRQHGAEFEARRVG